MAKTDFPNTYADLSFTERLDNSQQGYEPFKDAKAYNSINIEDEEKYWTRKQGQMATANTQDKSKQANNNQRTWGIVDRLVEALSK